MRGKERLDATRTGSAESWNGFPPLDKARNPFKTSQNCVRALRPTAVIAGGIDRLAGVLEAARSRGLRSERAPEHDRLTPHRAFCHPRG